MNRHKLCYRQATGFFGLAAAILLATASLAQAQTSANYWNNPGSDNWSNTANWTSTSNFNVVSTAPNSIYTGYVINNGGAVTINSNILVPADSNGVADVFVGGSDFLGAVSGTTGGGNGYVTMGGGTLATTTGGCLHEILGVASGSGVFTQNGGINGVYKQSVYPSDGNNPWFYYSSLELGFSSGGYGQYNMNAGSLGMNAVYVGASQNSYAAAGTGVFVQTGGSVGAFGAPSSQYNNAVGLVVGGQVFTVATSACGSYTLGNVGGAAGAGGPLFVGGVEFIGASGTGNFVQNAGTNAIVGGGQFAPNTYYGTNGSPGPLDNVDGALILGYYTGHQKVGSSLPTVGGCNAIGTYTLTGGLLTAAGGAPEVANGLAGFEVIGMGGTGIFTQTGGINNGATWELDVGGVDYQQCPLRNQMWLANNSGTTDNHYAYSCSGSYSLSGTGQLTSATERVGQGGVGVFMQTGGTNSAGQVTLGGYAAIYYDNRLTHEVFAPTPGTYNLYGGLLQTGSIEPGNSGGFINSPTGPGTQTFNFTAGTLQAGAGGFSGNGVPITVGTSANYVATLDANGQTMTIGSIGTSQGSASQVVVIDSQNGGGTVQFGANNNANPNSYTGGTTVLSGTLELLNAQALPSTSILTVGGPTAVVLSAQAGTLFGSDAVGQAAVVDGAGVDIPSSATVADASSSPIPVLASGVGMVPAASGLAPVPEPSTLVLLGAGLLSLVALRKGTVPFSSNEN